MSQASYKEALIPAIRRCVVKIGSSLLSTASGLDQSRIRSLVDQIEALRTDRRQFVLVTSGAVAAGLSRLGMTDRPKTIPQKQAAAAVGQIDLMAFYEECFADRGRAVGQMLLTRDDLGDRRRYLNAMHTLQTLLEAGAVPIVNENDTVVVEEMKLGDNDNLSASVAVLAGADLLVILSDVDAVCTSDPRRDRDAAPIPVLAADDPRISVDAGGSAGPFGTGGMATKLEACRKAGAAGIFTVVANGSRANILHDVFDPACEVGTLVVPKRDRLASRKHWIAHTLAVAGNLHLDDGAVAAIRRSGRSLLPSGISRVDGEFGPGECVRLVDGKGVEVARGLSNYGSVELRRIAGVQSRDIDRILGYKIADEVVHRDDLVLSENS